MDFACKSILLSASVFFFFFLAATSYQDKECQVYAIHLVIGKPLECNYLAHLCLAQNRCLHSGKDCVWLSRKEKKIWFGPIFSFLLLFFLVDSQCFGNHFRGAANCPLRSLLPFNPKGRSNRYGTRGSTLRGLITAPKNFLASSERDSTLFSVQFFSVLLSLCPNFKGNKKTKENEKGKQENKKKKKR